MSGYGSGRESGPSGREVDPAWVAWAEEQTIKLLRAQERFTYLPPTPEPAESPASDLHEPPPDPPTAELPEDDPIRVVHELRLDDPSEEALGTDRGPERVVDLADGRTLIVRVHHDNLRR